MQNPNEEYAQCQNEYMYKYEREKKYSTRCFMDNEECRNQNKKSENNEAIHSHSIQERRLKRISSKSKVLVLKPDLNNPFKSVLYLNPTKNTSTYKGFCNFHDKDLFKKFEDRKNYEYNNENIFLLSFRELTRFAFETRKIIDFAEWQLENWTSKERLRLLDWEIIFKLDEYILSKQRNNIGIKLKRIVLIVSIFTKHIFTNKLKQKWDLKRLLKEYDNVYSILNEYRNCLFSNNEIEMKFKVYKNAKNIGFSCTIYDNIKNSMIPLHIIIVPGEVHSELIISCKKSDFEKLSSKHLFYQIMEGNEYYINKVINLYKENVVLNPESYELDIAHSFFLEYEIPFGTLEFVKIIN